MFANSLVTTKYHAIFYFLSLVSARAAFPQNTVEHGINLFDAEKFDQAKQVFEKILESNANDSQAHYFLGRIYFNLGKHDDAVKYLQRAVTIAEGNIDFHFGLADVYGFKTRTASFLSAGKWAGKWKKELERAYEIDPKNLEARRRLINYYLNAPVIGGGDKEKGKRLAEETIHIDEIQGRLLLADAFRQTGKMALAVAEYKKVLELDPQNGAAYNSLGYFFLGQKDYAAAESHFKKYIEVVTADPNAYDSMGDYYSRRGMVDSAMAQYQKALEVDPKFSTSRFNLAQAYEEKKMTAEAIRHYEKIIELTPGHARAEDAGKRIKKLKK